MRIGIFTPLLSRFSLEDVLKKLKAKVIDTVELGTGTYPGDAHCKLSMLEESPKNRQPPPVGCEAPSAT